MAIMPRKIETKRRRKFMVIIRKTKTKTIYREKEICDHYKNCRKDKIH